MHIAATLSPMAITDRTGRLLVASALLLTACGGEDDRPAHEPTPVDGPTSEKGPGTPIADGVAVAPGSVMLGPAFPAPQDNDGSRLWRAVVIVEDDPADVFDEYVTQMEAMDHHLLNASTVAACSLPNGEPVVSGDDLDRSPSGFPIQCAMYGNESTIYSWHSSTASDAPWASHIVLGIDATDPSGRPPPATVPLEDVGPRPGLLTDPGLRPDGPSVGERLAPDLFDPMGRDPIEVVAGSEVLAPVAPSESVTGGYVAVARITGDPREVVARYVEQGHLNEVVSREEYEVGGRTVLRSWWDSAGGPKLYVTATTDDRGDWYALIEVFND